MRKQSSNIDLFIETSLVAKTLDDNVFIAHNFNLLKNHKYYNQRTINKLDLMDL